MPVADRQASIPSLTQMGTATVRIPSLPFEIRQHPPALPELDGCHVEFGQLIRAQGAADEQRQDDVIPFSCGGRPVRYGKQLLRLVASQPVPEAGSLLPDVRNVGQVSGLLSREHPVLPRLADHLPNGGEPDVNGRGRQGLEASRVLEEKLPGERSGGSEGEQIVESFGVVPTGVDRGNGVEDQLPEQGLGWTLPCPVDSSPKAGGGSQTAKLLTTPD